MKATDDIMLLHDGDGGEESRLSPRHKVSRADRRHPRTESSPPGPTSTTLIDLARDRRDDLAALLAHRVPPAGGPAAHARFDESRDSRAKVMLTT